MRRTPSTPAGQDLVILQNNRAAGRATMVPFVLNDHWYSPRTFGSTTVSV